MKTKVNKTISKRFSLSKNKKLIKRYAGQDHFNARSSGNITRKKRRDVGISKVFEKTIKACIN